MDGIRDAVEGKIDFQGQRLADRINQETLVMVTVSTSSPFVLRSVTPAYLLDLLLPLLSLPGPSIRSRLAI